MPAGTRATAEEESETENHSHQDSEEYLRRGIRAMGYRVYDALVGEGLMKVVGVLKRCRFRLEGRLDRLGEQVVPILWAKEWVLQHFLAQLLAT
eukprot:scaffold119983_cov42-Tisochrysis_lutea.AAC.3